MGVSWPGDGPCSHLPRVKGAAESGTSWRAQARRKPRPPFPASCTESWAGSLAHSMRSGCVSSWDRVTHVPREESACCAPAFVTSSLYQGTQRHSRRLRCLLSFAARTKSPFSLLAFLLPVFMLTFPTSNHLVNNKMKEVANIGSSLFVPCIEAFPSVVLVCYLVKTPLFLC